MDPVFEMVMKDALRIGIINTFEVIAWWSNGTEQVEILSVIANRLKAREVRS